MNVDQKGLGVLWANWIVKHVPAGGKVLEVRGVAGTSVDTDRHNGIHETLDASGKKWTVTEVVGKWDDGVAQKATADAIATSGLFAAITGQGGNTGIVQAMIDAKHPFVPFGGETENGFRKFCAAHASEGLQFFLTRILLGVPHRHAAPPDEPPRRSSRDELLKFLLCQLLTMPSLNARLFN